MNDYAAPAPGTISVTGVGTASIAPDVATITVGVQLVQPTVAAATQRSSALTTAVIAALKDKGVDAADVRTSNYHLHPEHDHRPTRPNGPPGPPPVIGYRVSNNLDVTVRNLDSLGEVIDAATQAAGEGAMVHGLNFGVADSAAAETLAREAAWADAHSRASELAALSGVTLGAVVALAEHRSGFGAPRPMPMARPAMAMDAAPPMEAGSSVISVTVSVEFAIS